MKILISGASGFFGDYIKEVWFKNKDEVTTIGIDQTDGIRTNFVTEIPVLKESYDYVIHAAGKAHVVPKTKEEEKAFYDVNFEGTKNFLSGIECCSTLPKGLLFVSSVAVYGKEDGSLISEKDPLLATDPYGKSKVLAEEYILEWGIKHDVKISIVRPPILIGKDAPGNLKAMIEGIKSGKYANIAGGRAKRSMVLAEDVANFFPVLLNKGGVYNLTDGYHPSFFEMSKTIGEYFGKRKMINIPEPIAKVMAIMGDLISFVTKKIFPFNSRQLSKMTNDLTFDDSLARSIGWSPRKVLDHTKTWL